MKFKIFLLCFLTLGSFCFAEAERTFVIAMHCAVISDETGRELLSEIPKLRKKGVNTLILQIGYNYQWTTHPELIEEDALSAEVAGEIAQTCRANGISIIPEINCVGHQSWEETTFSLLRVYPDFDETPGQYPNNEGIYCRSWCTSNDAIYPIVFDLIDEITKVFKTTNIHIGLDEIFLIGEDGCRRCKGKSKSDLLAKAINRFYDYCVKTKKLKMYIWGDRLINGYDKRTDYNCKWQTSHNGTYSAIDSIAKDIIICDWHYDENKAYGSIPYFLEKGFAVLPASYQDVDAARKLIKYSLTFRENGNMLGHMYTTWESIKNNELSKWKALVETIKLVR